jgi:hypothetical protein
MEIGVYQAQKPSMGATACQPERAGENEFSWITQDHEERG